MDSAHADERNLAHCADGRSTMRTDKREMTKIKEDHAKEIEKIQFENKIKFLESENNNRMKIMQLEKDNQSLTYQLQMLKLQTSHEVDSKKMVADHELEKKLVEKDKEIAAKEMKIKDMEKAALVKDREHQKKLLEIRNEMMIVKEKERELKIKDLELTKKEKLAQVEKEKGLEIQAFRAENGMTKALGGASSKENDVRNAVPTKEEQLLWGIDRFIKGVKSGLNLFSSYTEWYERMSSDLLVNGIPEYFSMERYCFIRKEYSERYNLLYFVSIKRTCNLPENFEFDYMFRTTKIEEEDTKIFLLHPNELSNNTYRKKCGQTPSFEHIEDFYFGEKNSLIFLVEFPLAKN